MKNFNHGGHRGHGVLIVCEGYEVPRDKYLTQTTLLIRFLHLPPCSPWLYFLLFLCASASLREKYLENLNGGKNRKGAFYGTRIY
jgi:hypothetical protein